MHEHTENFNKDRKYKKVKNLSHRTRKLKNTEKYASGFNSRLDEVEERISERKARAVEFTPAEQQKEKKF